VSVRVYVEGGFQSSTKSDCRQAFRSFFGKVIPQGSFKVIASGDRSAAFKDFCLALKQHREDYVILLVDSEEAVVAGPWQHLAARQGDHWHRPVGASDDQAHLMVQVMESWFLADKQVLTDYYDHGFLADSLPGQPQYRTNFQEGCLRGAVSTHRRIRKRGNITRPGTDLTYLSESTPIACEPPQNMHNASSPCWRRKPLREDSDQIAE
jgi:hypothetical protein